MVEVRSQTVGHLPVEEFLSRLDLTSLEEDMSGLCRGRPRGAQQHPERQVFNVPFSCCHGDLTPGKRKKTNVV